MKRVALLLISLILFISGLTADSKADSQSEVSQEPAKMKRVAAGIIAGYATTSKYGSGLEYGGVLNFGITKNIAVELRGLKFQGNVEGDPEGLSKGKLTVTPVQLSIQGRFPINDRVIPYLATGGDYYLNSFSIDSEIANSWDALGFDISEKTENNMGFHFGVGLDFLFSRAVGLNADFKYCLANTKGSWELTDQVSSTKTSGSLEKLKLNPIIFSVGLKYFF